jgi:transcriptional regulator with XRE-family HTH domain
MRTVIDPRFSGLLANLMMARGISQRALASRANVSQSHISELIGRTKNPSAQTAKALDDALTANGQLASLVAVAGGDDDLDRLAAATAMPGNINAATVDSLAAVLAAQRHLDDTMGSATLVGPVVAHLDTVTAMVRSAYGPVRPRLMGVAAQWAQFGGWLHTSVGKSDKAREWFSRALEWAIEADDAEMTATALSYQGHVAWLTAQWGSTVGLSKAALRDRTVYPGQRAYDAFQAARGHAALGELGDAQRMLALGDELVVATQQWVGETPPWQYYRQPWFWALERGLVYRYMTRWESACAAQAVAELSAGVAAMPADMQGADWAAEYLVHLAAAYADAGDMSGAREVLGRARRIAEATRSPRVQRLVVQRERALYSRALAA